ncbi:universal stress protein [Haloplanus halobius]|uniref:universal stress protein n=1 Tax=Haloplanus halobius TaxID=2934938 RepID=UPI00200BE8A8|nr:universal stress protein [Haloplanus sp. XH21]
MVDHVLVPTDGSEAARNAARHAIDLVDDTGGRVTALYVIDMGDADYVAVPSDIAETKERIRKKGEEFAAEVCEMAREAGVDCETAGVTGIPDETIVDYAVDNDIGLIAMGKYGKRDPDKPLVGNTARRVVQTSPIPVHTV